MSAVGLKERPEYWENSKVVLKQDSYCGKKGAQWAGDFWDAGKFNLYDPLRMIGGPLSNKFILASLKRRDLDRLGPGFC